jgi:hypothetical protein
MKSGHILVLAFIGLMLVSFSYLGSADSQIPSQQQLSAAEISSASNSFLDKTIVIPEDFQVLSKVIFGFKGADNVSFELMIILCVYFIFVLLLIHNILSAIPIFSNNQIILWVSAVIITLLTSVSGGLIGFAYLIYGFGNLLNVGNFKAVGLVFDLIIGTVAVLGLSKLLALFKKQTEKSEAETVGFNIATSTLRERLRNLKQKLF